MFNHKFCSTHWLLTALILLCSAANAETYNYDKAGRLTGVSYDDGTSITYQFDANGNLTGQTVNSGSAANKAPIANDDSFTIQHNATTGFDVTTNDADIDGTLDLTSVIIIAAPTSGAISVDATVGSMVYTPNTGFSGIDVFTYQISDNLGLTSGIATVTLTVLAAPVTPGPDDTGGNSGGSSGGGSLSILLFGLMILGGRRRGGGPKYRTIPNLSPKEIY